MMISDVPLLSDTTEKGDFQSSAYHRQAPWAAKRLILRSQLARQVRENEKEGIDTSVIVYDLTDRRPVYSHNTEYVHWAASLSKLFVTELLLEDLNAGKTNLDTVVSWDASDRRDGAGVYDAPGAPTSATVRDVLFDMLNKSGNTAVRVIVNKTMGGADAVNARYEAVPELKVTRLIPLGEGRFFLGYTTPAEVDYILNKLYRQEGEVPSFVKHALATNIFDDYGPRSQVKDKENITVIDKQGQLDDPEGNNRHDVGVIENAKNGHKLRYVLMTTNYELPAGKETADAVLSLQAFGRDMLCFEGDARSESTVTPKMLKEESKEVTERRMLY